MSRFVQPQVRLGSAFLTPQNTCAGVDRIAYVDAIVARMNEELTKGRSPVEVLALRDEYPFARNAIDLWAKGRRVTARARAGYRDRIHFDTARLVTVLVDGRQRRIEQMVSLELGRETPQLSALMALLGRGGTLAEIRALLRRTRLRLDDDFIVELARRRVLEEGVPTPVDPSDPSRSPASAASITWLGHAAVIFQAGGKTIWVDPCLRPNIHWKATDSLSQIFSRDHADSLLVPEYGPGHPQRALTDLPAPDVVLITHQDSDHFDLGVLMRLPEKTVIVVPEAERRPWEVDLTELLTSVLGPSRVVRTLGHGEEMKLGNIAIKAFPFTGEMPHALSHRWNCYLLKTPDAAVALLADSAVEDAQLEFLGEELDRPRLPLTLFSRAPYPESMAHRSGPWDTPRHAFNFARLWPWYTSLGDLMRPTRRSGPSYEQLAWLRRKAGLRSHFSYASGNVPWCRMQDDNVALGVPVSNMTRNEWMNVAKNLRRLKIDAVRFPYGVARPLPSER